ncbi:MAG: hypothetical protein HGB11_13430, partial [Chlorobiales bacterium]|nr:hypothetical protein [Chlorobiales bacterium]
MLRDGRQKVKTGCGGVGDAEADRVGKQIYLMGHSVYPVFSETTPQFIRQLDRVG